MSHEFLQERKGNEEVHQIEVNDFWQFKLIWGFPTKGLFPLTTKLSQITGTPVTAMVSNATLPQVQGTAVQVANDTDEFCVLPSVT